MSENLHLLEPCPWCAAGTSDIKPNGRIWSGMKWSEPVSVSVQHWCEPEPGQPSRMIERTGRDEASAIAAWNRRAQPAAPADAAPSVAPEPAPVAYKVWHREAKHCFCLASELPTEFRSDTGEPDGYFGGKVQPLFAHPPRAPLPETLHTFLNAAAGEGFVLDGVDAADLYIALFPERYAAGVNSIDSGAAK